MAYIPGRPQSFRHQRLPVDDCSPGRGNSAERRNKGRNISRRNWSLQRKPGLDYGMQSYARTWREGPKQAGSRWFARPCWLATSGATLYPPGVWFADAMTYFSGVTFCLVLLRFRLYAFVEAAALRSIVLRYAGAPIATRISFFFPFVYLEVLLFPIFFCPIAVFSLYGEYVVRSFLPVGLFYLVTTGWIFDISLCENSMKIKERIVYTSAPYPSMCPLMLYSLSIT